MSGQSHDIRQILRGVESLGWTVEKSRRSSHWQVRHPTTRRLMVVASSSSGGGRSAKNLISDLKRAGCLEPPA